MLIYIFWSSIAFLHSTQSIFFPLYYSSLTILNDLLTFGFFNFFKTNKSNEIVQKIINFAEQWKFQGIQSFIFRVYNFIISKLFKNIIRV